MPRVDDPERLTFCKKGQVCWFGYSGNGCYDVTNCPSEETVQATAEEVRYQIWEAPLNEHGECSTGCTFNDCACTSPKLMLH